MRFCHAWKSNGRRAATTVPSCGAGSKRRASAAACAWSANGRRASFGRPPNLLARFRNHTLRIWEKRGIRQAGFWTTLVGEPAGDLSYLLAWESLAGREAKCAKFQVDPEWIAARTESEKDGPINASVSNQLLPTAFSSVK